MFFVFILVFIPPLLLPVGGLDHGEDGRLDLDRDLPPDVSELAVGLG